MRRKIPTLIMACIVGGIFGMCHMESANNATPWYELNKPQQVTYEVKITPIEEPVPEPVIEVAEGYIDSDIPVEVQEAAEKWGKIYNICPEFLMAMAFKESSYIPTVSNGNCLGLMQVNPRWHGERIERLGVTDIYSIDGNMAVAADYLAELFNKYEDPAVVLMVYNGDSRAQEEGYISDYAEKILTLSAELEEKHGKTRYIVKSH